MNNTNPKRSSAQAPTRAKAKSAPPSAPPRRPSPEELNRNRRRSDEIRQIKRSNFLFYATVIISAIILAVAVYFMISAAVKFANKNVSSTENNGPPPIENTDPNIPTHTSSSARLEETNDMGIEYLDQIIFVGDSNTAHMRSFGVLSGGKQTKQVWTPVSQTLMLNSEITNKKIVFPETGEELTIAAAAGIAKPKYMILTLGTNGINYLNKEQFKLCYKKLINAIKETSPETKLILQTIFPVTDWYQDISNETIDNANEWLLEVAEECEIKYLDSAGILKNSAGALAEEYNTYHKDGYHLNTEAYSKLLAYIRTHAYVD